MASRRKKHDVGKQPPEPQAPSPPSLDIAVQTGIPAQSLPDVKDTSNGLLENTKRCERHKINWSSL